MGQISRILVLLGAITTLAGCNTYRFYAGADAPRLKSFDVETGLETYKMGGYVFQSRGLLGGGGTMTVTDGALGYELQKENYNFIDGDKKTEVDYTKKTFRVAGAGHSSTSFTILQPGKEKIEIKPEENLTKPLLMTLNLSKPYTLERHTKMISRSGEVAEAFMGSSIAIKITSEGKLLGYMVPSRNELSFKLNTEISETLDPELAFVAFVAWKTEDFLF